MAASSEDWLQQVEELLALQSIYQDEFRVVSAEGLPDDTDLDPEQLIALEPPETPVTLQCEASIAVDLPDKAITVMLGLPDVGEDAAVPVGPPVQHLPPITAHITLPPTYPSADPPSVKLQAMWLTPQQLSDLSHQLHILWADQGTGFPICFTWLDWLKSSSLPHLHISTTLLLSDPTSTTTSTDPSSHSISAHQVAANIMRYEASQQLRTFQSSSWLCSICYEQLQGTKCVRLPDCHHYFCTSCLSQHCSTQLSEGAVDNLRCPQPDCRKQLPPYALQQLLSSEDYARWESLLLQRTLDKMDDVVYCPRCNTICIEESGNMSQCSQCFFAYCTLCMDSFHPGTECLDPIQKLALLEKRKAGAGAYDADRARRDLDQVNQLMSLKAIRQQSKACPSCRMAIVKNEGCNKMTCAYCSTAFCWKCEQVVAGYDHFKLGCKLFDDDQVAAWNRMMAAQVGERQWEVEQGQLLVQVQGARPGARFCRCPVCGQENVKQGNNNLIRCWACNSQSCYKCKAWLQQRAGLHFGPRGCKQHTAD